MVALIGQEVENCGSDEDSSGSVGEEENMSDANDNSFEESYMEGKEVLDNTKMELISGDKAGSEWLVIDDVYIFHKYRSTENETFWECSGRRHFGCNIKAATTHGDDDNLELLHMYKAERHDCGQTKMGPIMQKFRNRLKLRMKDNYKNKYHKVFNEEKKRLMNEYKDFPELHERIIYEINDKESYRACAQRARAKSFPKNPTKSEEMDLSLIGLERFELGRCSHFDPEVKDKEIILLGTPLTAKAWSLSEFKSGDGTFKICPRQFFQVFVLMGLFGGVYLPCMIGLLPDKTQDTYGRFFGLVRSYLDKNDLPNDFSGHFFMTDFEVNIRTNFNLFWPMARLLGCYFHFSQVCTIISYISLKS